MKKLIAVLAALIVTSLTVPAAAQSPSPEAIAAARTLLEKMQFGDQFRRNFPQLLQRLKPLFVQNRVDLQEKFDAMMPFMPEAMTKQLPTVLEAVAVVYAKNYSVEELGDLSKFYDSPIGQKLLATTPIISQESTGISQTFSKAVIADAQRRLQLETLKKQQPAITPSQEQKQKNNML
jgi:hypothetical protein